MADNTSTRRSTTGLNTSTQQTRRSATAHVSDQNNPPSSTNNPNPQSGVFSFDIPGFKIIIIPVTENSNQQEIQHYLDPFSSNITNDSQIQFQ